MGAVRRVLSSDHAVGWALVFPAVALIGVFGIVPVVWSFFLSLEKTNLIAPPAWAGLSNYKALFHDPLFRTSVDHTLIYTGLFVPASVAGGLGLAIALNSKVAGVRLYRTAVFVPVVASTIATAIIFLWVFDPVFGIANWALGKVHVGPFGYFQSPNAALYSIVALTVWGWVGFDMIIYLAAIQGIPAELYEAAEIDGADRWGRFRRITLPMLGPATLFLIVWSTINALQLFDEVYFLTKGGPLYSTYVVVYYLFSLAFEQGIAGYAAAMAYVLLMAILVMTLIQLWVGKKVVYYSS